MPLTDQDRANSRTKEARDKAARNLVARHPVFWLRRQVRLAKLHPEVRARIDALFLELYEGLRLSGGITGMPKDKADVEAKRIAAEIHWLKATHSLISMDTGQRNYITVSKVASQWTTISNKMSSSNGKHDKGRQNRRQVPTAAARPDQDEDEGEREVAPD